MQALRQIENQLEQNRTLNQYMTAVQMLEDAQVPSAAIRQYRQQALTIARHQTRVDSRNPQPWVAIARLSLGDANESGFRTATETLVSKFPENKYSDYFQGIQAIKDQDWATAESALRKARAKGIPERDIGHWLKMAIDNQRWIWEYAWFGGYVLCAWLVGLLLLYLCGKMFSVITLGATERGDPARVSTIQATTRRIYRTLIVVAGLYYYLSLPMLVVVSIAMPLALAYGLLHVPVLSLWLIGLLTFVSVGSVITAVSGIRTAFISVAQSIQGMRVGEAEQPELWRVVREVAERVGTRPVDSIWLRPSAELGVFERGTFLQRLRDKGERVLLLGVGVLDGFSQQAFRAVLAHEYGHFLNRDTAGGNQALRINLAMHNFAAAIMEQGPVRWWHVSAHFLRFYYIVFNRLTFGASRLQEVLADRVAVVAYGAQGLHEGLPHVIRCSLEFECWVNDEIGRQLRQESQVSQIHQLAERPHPSSLEQIELLMTEELSRPTSETDTHPSPRDRFAFANRFGAHNSSAITGMVWDLFKVSESVRHKLHEQLSSIISEKVEAIGVFNQANIAYLDQVLLTHPCLGGALEARASLHLEQGEFKKAVSDAERAIKHSLVTANARMIRAIALRSLKQYDSAVAEIEKLVTEYHVDRQRLYVLLGEWLAEMEQWERAVAAFTESLQLRDVIGTRLARGRAEAQRERHEAAIADFSCFIERYPYCPDAYVDRAASYLALGRRDAARDDLKRATAVTFVHPRAHRELARLLLHDEMCDCPAVLAAVRHARIATLSGLEPLETLPVLIEAYVANADFVRAIGVVDKLLPLLPESEQATWRSRREEYSKQSGVHVVAKEVYEQAEPITPALPLFEPVASAADLSSVETNREGKQRKHTLQRLVVMRKDVAVGALVATTVIGIMWCIGVVRGEKSTQSSVPAGRDCHSGSTGQISGTDLWEGEEPSRCADEFESGASE